ncbi:IS30 family transposase [Halanaerobium saccharolyticum]|uniref:IS30 family transposase n=1 Tax=Halanaerobium saccharolyticum TaxID=43595 RepID=A0A4R6M115_9FIRM|nr:IS30 family transposase [Halanaerobium saccharolyticum]
MDYLNDTPNSRKNKHLNAYEHGQIALLHSKGMSASAISKRLNRASNTVRNELKRGTVSQIKANKTVEIYFPDTGQRVYENNRKNCGPKFKLLECYNFIEHVIDEFYNSDHSIDSICGSAKLHNKFPNSEMICTKTLYNYIDAGLLEIKNIDLPLKLKRASKSRRIRNNKKKLGTSIEERPESINNRSEFGHWEIDTVIGKKTKEQAALLTMTERTTRSQIICKIADKSSYSVQEAMTTLIKETGNLFSTVFKSITSDNGSEFSELARIEEVVDTRVYYTHPYSSWERGTNERHNA